MPNRIIRESICTSESVNNLTAEEERFFYRLILQVDDHGRMDARPVVLRARCFPMLLDSISIADICGWLLSLVRENLVELYQVDKQPYLNFVNWATYQRIRAANSKYPAPTPESRTSADIGGHSPSNAPVVVIENRESRIESDIPPMVPLGTTPTEKTLPLEKNDEALKEKYGAEGLKNIALTGTEHGSLVSRFGLQGAASWIEELSLAKASKGYKSKSDYHTILAWARRRGSERKGGGNGANRQVPGKLPTVYERPAGQQAEPDDWADGLSEAERGSGSEAPAPRGRIA